jgi:hypothetical protein
MATILKHWREAATLIIAARSNNITNKFNYDILMMKRSGFSNPTNCFLYYHLQA